MPVSIRPARRVDHDALILLHAHCLPNDVLPDFTEGHWWLAWDGERAAAFCGLSESGYLCRAGVHRDYRGQGIQKRLILIRLRKARSLGLPHVYSDTSENPASANSLIACGFRMYDPDEPWGLPTSLYWRKPL